MIKKAVIKTLGCKVNQYDSQAISEDLQKAGYEIVENGPDVSLCIINTCTVTSAGDRKARNIIRKMQQAYRGARIAVVGCYAEGEPQQIKSLNDVHYIIGTSYKDKIVSILEDCPPCEEPYIFVGPKNKERPRDYEALAISALRGHTRAFVKIQDGCDHFCSYCRVPFVRGRSRSRKHEHIINEVRRLVDSGTKEIVLTAVDLGSFAKDLKEDGALIKLIRHLENIKGLERFRLSSINPNDLSLSLIKTLQSIKSFCPHFHIPLQSGSQEVLKNMCRPYKIEAYLDWIHKLKSSFDQLALTTDIMVGFPGETEHDFQCSLDIARNVAFSKIHIFRYSMRKDTLVRKMALKPVSSILAKQRLDRMMALETELSLEYKKAYIGHVMDVLVETYHHQYKLWEGMTRNYLRVYFSSEKGTKNQIVSVLICSIFQNGCKGEML